ncbi:hypothetical protein VTN49DRAFT_1527 [Thermomyces lanuginosus]|uniref:uncharacterized protein n=1 Tax=Thermomyces lanuginosus TaxID=5541 RepID=UPI003743F7B3
MLVFRRALCRAPACFRQYRAFSTGTRVVNVHHVKFRKPWFRRFATTCVLYGVAFHLWSSLVLLQFDGDVEPESVEHVNPTASNEVSRRNAAQLEEEEATFIPLTLPSLQRGELYKSTDEEWQRFAELNSKPERISKLREELANIVAQRVQHSLQGVYLIGTPVQIEGNWIVPRYPYRAPPHYVQAGLMITDNEAAIVLRPVPPEQGDRIWKALVPIDVATAMWDAFRLLWRINVMRLDDYLNGSKYSNSAIISMTEAALDRKKQQSSTSHLPSVSEWESSHTSPSETEQRRPSSTRPLSDDRGTHPSLLISLLQKIPLPNFAPGSDLYRARAVFNLSLSHAQARRRRRATPNRGVCYFEGMVALAGPVAWCRVSVSGEYDPAKNEWTDVQLKLREINRRAQPALGDLKRRASE